MADFERFEVKAEQQAMILTLQDPRLSATLLISELHDELLEFVQTVQPRELVIDFSLVTFCSTAVINGVLRVKKRIAEACGCLVLCGMCPDVRESFRVLNLDGTVFDICADRDEALTQLSARRV